MTNNSKPEDQRDRRSSLESVGRALLPTPDWKARLATALDIRKDTIQQWLSGRQRLPKDHGIWAKLDGLLAEHEREVK